MLFFLSLPFFLNCVSRLSILMIRLDFCWINKSREESFSFFFAYTKEEQQREGERKIRNERRWVCVLLFCIYFFCRFTRWVTKTISTIQQLLKGFWKKQTYIFFVFVLHFSSGNLATIFHAGEPASTIPVATTAYVPPKQPKKGIFIRQKQITWLLVFFY